MLPKAHEIIEIKNGKFVRRLKFTKTKDRSLSTKAFRNRQKEILEKSKESLLNDAIDTRNHTAMTMAIDPELLPEAKERIDQFMHELTDFLESNGKKKVYELIINLFPLQKVSGE